MISVTLPYLLCDVDLTTVQYTVLSTDIQMFETFQHLDFFMLKNSHDVIQIYEQVIYHNTAINKAMVGSCDSITFHLLISLNALHSKVLGLALANQNSHPLSLNTQELLH